MTTPKKLTPWDKYDNQITAIEFVEKNFLCREESKKNFQLRLIFMQHF